MATLRIERAAAPPPGLPLLTSADVNEYWVIEHPSGWKVVLGQNSAAGRAPEILEARSGMLFVALYGALAASLDPRDGRVIAWAPMRISGLAFLSALGTIVVAHGDQDLAVFSADGRLLWVALTDDVIEDLSIAEGRLKVEDVSGRIYRFNLASGELID